MTQGALARGYKSFYEPARTLYRANPTGEANGSLMRNAAVAVAMCDVADECAVIETTVQQSIITHYGPAPVLTCVLHSLLIHRALRGDGPPAAPPTIDTLAAMIAGPWTAWKTTTSEFSRTWLETVGEKLVAAETTVLEGLRGFEDFDPYHFMYKGISGGCTLSLKVALWALHWSYLPEGALPHCGVPHWLPRYPFTRARFSAIRWVALIGADADTYGAIAGALLAAHHPATLPAALCEQLQVRHELYALLPEN
eukprot:TRINITY_DN4842_c0_g1_i2.p2 TRINITY_DN4842_c0_g1~~TRINITY_DN4842_c0_g1_i2.p2  ORF type:complete len:254 (-),score=53.83 TRINITY_DN4842_c0_g1_i2:127-888(-)